MHAEEKFMLEAIALAKQSARNGDYALGAIIVSENAIVGRGTTNLKHENDPTVHAEIVAIRDACQKLGTRFLKNAVLYTTHEPCPMCASAAIWARMNGIVFGATLQDGLDRQNLEGKFTWRQIEIPCEYVLGKGNPKLELVSGFMREDCLNLFDLSS